MEGSEDLIGSFRCESTGRVSIYESEALEGDLESEESRRRWGRRRVMGAII